MSEPTGDADAALKLIDKIRALAEGLPAEERVMLATLLGPGIEAAWADAPASDELTTAWTSTALAAHLQAAVRRRELRPDLWLGGAAPPSSN
ncbi:MAG: hypothetical protein R2704_15390 [Microthrixaceae bacterium]|nr:hypothetical protein [Microthrixaceae bacterium]